MKPSNLIIVIIAFILTEMNYPQSVNDKNILNNLYLKAGYEFAELSNSSFFKSGRSVYGKGGVICVTASIGYDYTRRLQFEIQYKHMGGLGYGYDRERLGLDYPQGASYYKSGYGHTSTNFINLRSNYFVNENRRENPIYYIWSFNFGIQKVYNSELFEYADSTVTVINKYNRLVVGPEAGFGIYFDLGIINFLTEFTFSTRFSPLRNDKKYTENSLLLNFSSVIDF